MSEDERGELLRHLKIKWAAVNVEYQKLGFVMDIGELMCHAALGVGHWVGRGFYIIQSNVGYQKLGFVMDIGEPTSVTFVWPTRARVTYWAIKHCVCLKNTRLEGFGHQLSDLSVSRGSKGVVRAAHMPCTSATNFLLDRLCRAGLMPHCSCQRLNLAHVCRAVLCRRLQDQAARGDGTAAGRDREGHPHAGAGRCRADRA